MSVTGKQWTAVLWRNLSSTHGSPDLTTILEYDHYNTTPDEIAELYPALSWDEVTPTTPNELQRRWLPNAFPTPSSGGYADDEEGILDIENQHLDDPYGVFEATAYFNGHAEWHIRWDGALWKTDNIYHGDPAGIWALYPSQPVWADTEPTPFGAFGNGLITNQVVSWANGGAATTSQFPSNPGPADTGNVTIFIRDETYIFTPIYDTQNTNLDGGGDGTEATDDLTIRCWGFSLDGHDFAVWRIGGLTADFESESRTFVYDLTTQQWSEWSSPGRTSWRAHCGQNWVGCQAFTAGFGNTDVFAGDDSVGTIWRLNVVQGRDERAVSQILPDDKITKGITGGLSVSGREIIPCGAIQVELAKGAPTQEAAYMQLEISDDLGKSWVDCGSVTSVENDFSTVFEWRGLGVIRAPGRLFRLTDDGATVRVGRADLR